MSETPATDSRPPLNPRPLTVAIASIILFLIFFNIGSGPSSMLISGAFGVLATILAIREIRAGRKHPTQIIALVLGLIGAFIGVGLGIFTLIFIGATPL